MKSLLKLKLIIMLLWDYMNLSDLLELKCILITILMQIMLIN